MTSDFKLNKWLVVLEIENEPLQDIQANYPDAIGIYRVPVNFCECSENQGPDTKGKRNRGVKWNWMICAECKKALERWHHALANIVQEEMDPEARVFLNYTPKTSGRLRDFYKEQREKRKRALDM